MERLDTQDKTRKGECQEGLLFFIYIIYNKITLKFRSFRYLHYVQVIAGFGEGMERKASERDEGKEKC
jgi:hypothetical protein